MADGDDEETFILGSPLEILEDNEPRKKPVPVHEQVVTDTEGRRRFHGAFTGGFSAGYYNTVGSQSGWTPSTFKSSRSQKGEKTVQRPEDFMDDEDLGEFGIAPRQIKTTNEFLTTKEEKRKPAHELSDGQPWTPALQDLVQPARITVGMKLLRKMGWKEGQGIGARVRRGSKKTYGCSGPDDKENQEEDIYAKGLLFAPKDVETVDITAKDDKHGLGYKGIDPALALYTRPTDWLGLEKPSSNKNLASKGQAFGVGAFEEEDDDIYAQDHLSNYDIDLSKEEDSTRNYGWTGSNMQSDTGGIQSLFKKADKPLSPNKVYPPPRVPKNFKPVHVFSEQNQQQPKAAESRHSLKANDRGKMLGETPLASTPKSVFEFVKTEDQGRLPQKSNTHSPGITTSGSNKTSDKPTGSWSNTFQQQPQPPQPSSHSFTSGSQGFKPFAKDPAKASRYEQYLANKGNTGELYKNSNLTEWERDHEIQEFSRAALIFQPLSGAMAMRFTSAKTTSLENNDVLYEEVPAQEVGDEGDKKEAAKMKMFGQLTRDTLEWHPDRLLCKRFNIPDPYPGSKVIGVPKVKREKFSMTNFLTPVSFPEHPEHVSQASRTPTEQQPQPSPEESKKVSGKGKPSLFQLAIESGKLDSDSGTSFGSKPVVVPDDHTTKDAEQKESAKPGQTCESSRPPMDLFKAIFADSSEDNADSSDEDLEKDDNHEIKETVDNEKVDSGTKTSEGTLVEAVTAKDVDSVGDSTSQTASKGFVLQEVSSTEAEVLTWQREAQFESDSQSSYGPLLPPVKGSIDVSADSKLSGKHAEELEWSERKEMRKKIKKDLSESESDSTKSRKKSKKRTKERSKKGKDKSHKGEGRVRADSRIDHKSDTKRKKKRKEKYKVSDDSDSDSYDDSEDSETDRRKKSKKKGRDRYSEESSDDDSHDDDSARNTKRKKLKKKSKEHRSKKESRSGKESLGKLRRVEVGKVKKSTSQFADKSLAKVKGPKVDFPVTNNEKIKERTGLKTFKESNSYSSKGDQKVEEKDTGSKSQDQQIISKLKNLQSMKRMRAADFM